MIASQLLARQVSELMLDCGARLDASIASMQSQLSDEEFRNYRRAIGRVMGVMLLDVMNPIYAAHPELKPTKLD